MLIGSDKGLLISGSLKGAKCKLDAEKWCEFLGEHKEPTRVGRDIDIGR